MRKSFLLWLLLIFFLVFSLCFLPACKKSTLTRKEKPKKVLDSKKAKIPEPISLAQLKQPTFITTYALKHIKYLSATIGPRREGSLKEKAAADYVASELKKMGYNPQTQSFSLPDGSLSQNIIATKVGEDTTKHLVIGAHYDTKTTVCPGADDNASGVGILLELARILKNYSTYLTIDFVAFGAEELFDSNKDNHHFGSRHYVNSLSPPGRGQVFGMISIDMVGAGSNFCVRSSRSGSKVIVNRLISESTEAGHTVRYLSDPGYSDHESFEQAGIPSAWLQWRPSSNYHSPRDVYGTIKPGNIEITGKTGLNFILSLDENKLNEMVDLEQ